jgi:ATP-dependent DNA helicase RecG
VDSWKISVVPGLGAAGLSVLVCADKAGEIQSLVGVKHRQTFRENYLNALIGKGWLGRTIPDKPQSRLQRYQTTDEGKKWLQGATNRSPSA